MSPQQLAVPLLCCLGTYAQTLADFFPGGLAKLELVRVVLSVRVVDAGVRDTANDLIFDGQPQGSEEPQRIHPPNRVVAIDELLRYLILYVSALDGV
ncbi:MAG: hypothetical protein OXG27_13790 [Chloroflexi bacterium]|nr:hypothetical protein [Chloroflexota bacterium]